MFSSTPCWLAETRLYDLIRLRRLHVSTNKGVARLCSDDLISFHNLRRFGKIHFLYVLREGCFEREVGRCLWNPILNVDVQSTCKLDKERGAALCTPINQMLTSYMENSERLFNFAKRRALLDVCVGMIGTKMALDNAGSEERYPPATGRWYLLTGREFADQTGNNELVIREVQRPGFVILVNAFKVIFLLACPASHTCLHYLIAEEN